MLLLTAGQGPILAGMSRKGTAGPVHVCDDLSAKDMDGGPTSLPGLLLPLFPPPPPPTFQARSGRCSYDNRYWSRTTGRAPRRQCARHSSDLAETAQLCGPVWDAYGSTDSPRRVSSGPQGRPTMDPCRTISRKMGWKGVEWRLDARENGLATEQRRCRSRRCDGHIDISHPSCAPIGDGRRTPHPFMYVHVIVHTYSLCRSGCNPFRAAQGSTRSSRGLAGCCSRVARLLQVISGCVGLVSYRASERRTRVFLTSAARVSARCTSRACRLQTARAEREAGLLPLDVEISKDDSPRPVES